MRLIQILSTALGLVLLFGLTPQVDAARENVGNRVAHLSGAAEVPPVGTRTTGQAIFKVRGTSLTYKLNMANLVDAIAGHVHCGAIGENGPVGLTLFAGAPQSGTGTIAEGPILEPDTNNACGWTTNQDILDAIVDGLAYVNIHTLANPSGEVRGQLR